MMTVIIWIISYFQYDDEDDRRVLPVVKMLSLSVIEFEEMYTTIILIENYLN